MFFVAVFFTALSIFYLFHCHSFYLFLFLFFYFFIFYFLFLITSLSLLRNSGRLYRVRHAQQPQEERHPFLPVCVQYLRVFKQWHATRSYQCVCSIYVCSNNGMPPVPTSVCAVFTCVQTMACHPFLPVCVQYLRVFKQWHATRSYQCVCSIYVCSNNGMPPVPTSVCAVFTCVQTMACHPFLPVCVQYLRVFKQWHATRSYQCVCSIYVCSNNGMPPVPTSVCAVFTCVQTMACHPFLPVCVQYLRVFKQWHGCQCLEFLTCAQMMHAIAHENCTNTVKPILNWAHYLFAECTSDSSPNYNSFIN